MHTATKTQAERPWPGRSGTLRELPIRMPLKKMLGTSWVVSEFAEYPNCGNFIGYCRRCHWMVPTEVPLNAGCSQVARPSFHYEPAPRETVKASKGCWRWNQPTQKLGFFGNKDFVWCVCCKVKSVLIGLLWPPNIHYNTKHCNKPNT